MAKSNVYLSGTIVSAGDARISVFDAALLHGASTFTTMLAHNGVVFRFDRHLARLFETVEALGLRTDATPEVLQEATYQLLDANELAEARLRITLTPGGGAAAAPATIITADPLPNYPDDWYAKGIDVIVTSLSQAGADPTSGAKTGCYLPRVLAREEAAAKGAEEALWFTADNRLAEACFCNVFLVLESQVHTPPRETPVLPGVVRQAVLGLCGQLGIPCHEDRPLTVHEMLAAEEMFLTASCSGVRPVVRIERHAVGDETVGPVTRRVMEAYRQLLETECIRRN